MKKRTTGIVLVAGMLGVATAFPAGSASNVLNPVMLTRAADVHLDAEGECGTDATYIFKDGLLSIRGTGEIAEGAFENQEEIKTVVIEEGITAVGAGAFIGCTSMESISLPSSVKGIGNDAFKQTALTELKLPQTVEELGWNILDENEGVKEILIPKTVTYMGGGNETLGGSAIEKVVFEAGTTKILDNACSGATRLTEVVIPEGVTGIGNNAFAKTAISKLEFPTTLTSIGWSFLKGNENLKELYVPESVTYMGGANEALESSGVEKVTFGDGMEKIPDSACAGAEKLSEVVFPEGVKSIGDNAFKRTGLTAIAIPESITEIGNDAFKQTGITELKLPSKVEKLGWNILDKNTGVKELFIPKTVTYMGGGNETLGGSAIEKVVFEEGTTNILDNACSGATKLAEVVIPESVTEIGNDAFKQTGITELKLPSKVEKLGWNILDKNTGVKELFIPKTVTYMGGGNETLNGSAVETLTFEDGMLAIPGNACAQAKKLKKVYMPVSVESFGEAEDYKDSPDLTFYCYEDSEAAYYAAENNIAHYYVGKAVNTKITLKNVTKKFSSKAQKLTLKPSSNNKLGVYRFTSNRADVKVDANGNVTINPNFSGIANITVQQTATVQYKKGTTTVKISVSPSATKLSKLSNGKGKKMTVKWAKNKYVSGYQLQYSTNSKFKGAKSKKVAGSKATSTTLSSLKLKKTYYVRIRTYKTDANGTLYSAWSSAKKIKITK